MHRTTACGTARCSCRGGSVVAPYALHTGNTSKTIPTMPTMLTWEHSSQKTRTPEYARISHVCVRSGVVAKGRAAQPPPPNPATYAQVFAQGRLRQRPSPASMGGLVMVGRHTPAVKQA